MATALLSPATACQTSEPRDLRPPVGIHVAYLTQSSSLQGREREAAIESLLGKSFTSEAGVSRWEWVPADALVAGEEGLAGQDAFLEIHGFGPSRSSWEDSGLILFSLRLVHPLAPPPSQLLLWEYRVDQVANFSSPVSHRIPIGSQGLTLLVDLVGRYQSLNARGKSTPRFVNRFYSIELSLTHQAGVEKLRRGIYMIAAVEEERAELSPNSVYLLLSVTPSD